MSIDSISQQAGSAPDLRRARRRQSPAGDARVDRLPPHAIEAEQGLLGCVLLAPAESINTIQASGFQIDEFYDLRHQTIWNEMEQMFSEQKPVEIVGLQQRLKDKGMLEPIGGIPYLNSMQDAVPSAANLTYYLDIVREKATLRRLIHFCTDVVGRVYTYEGDVDALIDDVERDAMRVKRSSHNIRPSIRQSVHEAISRIERKFDTRGALSGLATGFPDLDYYTDGLCGSELIVPAAFPSVGKTSLAMNIVEHVAIDQQLPVLVFSQEMTNVQIVTRMLQSQSRVNIREAARGHMADADFPKLTGAAARVAAANIQIIDDAETVQQVVAEARRAKQERGVRLVVVDYLQLLSDGGRRRDQNREQEVSNIAASLKRLAKELDVPVLTPSQLTDDGKLRESRAIGQHADGIWIMSAEATKAGEPAKPTQDVSLYINKNRNGPRGVTVNLVFLSQYTRFESASRVSDEDVPPENQ